MSKLNDERSIQVHLFPNPSYSLRIAYFRSCLYIGTNIEISEQLGVGKNAMHCNKKRTALRWTSQCSALANSMAWVINYKGEASSDK